MRRRLFTLFSVLSLVLCLGTAVLWARSYFVADRIVRLRTTRLDQPPDKTQSEASLTTGRKHVVSERQDLMMARGMAAVYQRIYVLHSNRPEIIIRWMSSGIVTEKSEWRKVRRGELAMVGSEHPDTFWGRCGFYYASDETQSPEHKPWQPREGTWFVSFPLWPLFLFTALLPGCYIGYMQLHWRQRRAGRCPQCGYDLRATPDRCPECGTAASGGTIPTA